MADDTEPNLPLHETFCVTLADLTRASGLSADALRELVELGAFEPQTRAGEWLFASHCIELARAARRLQTDFELPPAGVALALTYIERIRELEQRLHELECQLLELR